MVNSERLIGGLVDLLKINSPSRHEAGVADSAAETLRGMGFTVKVDGTGGKIGGDTGNVIATLPASAPGKGRKILLCAHMDTVGPTEGIRIIREDGILRQEGALVLGSDDKGGIAAILEGVRSALESGKAHGQIQVLFLVAEEVGLLGSKNLDMSLLDSELAYVFDSGSPVGHVVTSAPTHDNITATFTGRTAHAGMCPEDGISAIQAAAVAISRMKLGRIDEETSANVGVISGGSARNIVPGACEVQAEARSRDTAKLDAQDRHMLKCLEDAAAEVGATVDILKTRQYLGYKHAEDSNLVAFAQAAGARIGLRPPLMAHGGGSDCNIMNARGLSTAVMGVGYEKIHTAEEYVAESDLVRCAEFVEAMVLESAV